MGADRLDRENLRADPVPFLPRQSLIKNPCLALISLALYPTSFELRHSFDSARLVFPLLLIKELNINQTSLELPLFESVPMA
jgi:hypothetical protein